MPIEHPRDRQWELLVTELRGCQDEQLQGWDDIDEVLISRYLAGECDQQERELVEYAYRSLPGVRECIDLAKEVLADRETAAPAEEPTPRASRVLGAASSRPAPRSIFRRAGRAVFQSAVPNWAAAACLLIAIGLGGAFMMRLNSLNNQVVALNAQVAELTRPPSVEEPPVTEAPPALKALRSEERVATAVRGVAGIGPPVHTLVTTAYSACYSSSTNPDGNRSRTGYRPVYETRSGDEAITVPRDILDIPPTLPSEELLPALRHRMDLVRWAAADALTRIAASDSKADIRAAIVDMLEKRDGRGRAAADYVLTGRIAAGFGTDLSELAITALDSPDKVVRWAGLHYFLVVRRCFEDKGPTAASPTFFQPEFTARLIQQLVRIVRQEGEDPVLRKAAIYLLGQFGNDAKPATGDLIQIVTTDEDPQARRWAAYALGQIGPDASSAVPHLAQILLARASDSDHKENDIVFPAVAYAFGELCSGDRESPRVKEVVPALIESLKDPNPNISHWAAFALWRTFTPATYRSDTDAKPVHPSGPTLAPSPNPLPSYNHTLPPSYGPEVSPGPRPVLPEEQTTARPAPQEGGLERPALTPPQASSLPARVDTGGWRPSRD